MTFTRNSLKSLIEEVVKENNAKLLEMPQHPVVGQEQTGKFDKDPDGYDGEIAKKSLYHMARQADQLHDIVAIDEDLEPWVSEKISLAADYLEKAFKALTYDKSKPEGR
jgi:hypothetical protein